MLFEHLLQTSSAVGAVTLPTAFFPGRFEHLLNCLGLFGTVLDCSELFGTVWNCLGLFGNCLGLFKTVPSPRTVNPVKPVKGRVQGHLRVLHH